MGLLHLNNGSSSTGELHVLNLKLADSPGAATGMLGQRAGIFSSSPYQVAIPLCGLESGRGKTDVAGSSAGLGGVGGLATSVDEASCGWQQCERPAVRRFRA